MAAIATKWVAILEPSATLILIWLAGRTLVFGKEAERIALRDFILPAKHDQDFAYFAPLPLSMNTLRKHLHMLCDRNLINIYAVKSAVTGAESQARMFELECKTLLDEEEFAARNCKILANIDAQVAEEVAGKCPGKGVPPPNGWEGSSYIHYMDSGKENGTGKPVLLSAGSAAPIEVGGLMATLAVPKKARVRITRNDNAAAALAQITQRSAARQAVRMESVKTELTIKGLQALLDKEMRTYHPALPRMIVTHKPFGVLRKRIAAATIDINKFTTFCVRDWTILAEQNFRAMQRDPSKLDKGTPIPMAPSFHTWAYRLPYFIACYANSLANSVAGDRDTEVAALKSELVKAQQRNTELQKTLVRRTARRVETTRTVRNSDETSWTPPEWE